MDFFDGSTLSTDIAMNVESRFRRPQRFEILPPLFSSRFTLLAGQSCAIAVLLVFTLMPKPALADQERAPEERSNRPIIDYITGPSERRPLDIARNHLDLELIRSKRMRRVQSLGSSLEEYHVESQHRTPRTGISRVLFRQVVNGIPVWNGDYMVNVSRDGRILNAHDRFARNTHSNLLTRPVITAQDALHWAADELGLEVVAPFNQLEDRDDLGHELLFSEGGVSLDPIPVSLKYVELDDETLRLVWNVVLRELSGLHWWDLNVDAETGELLTRSDWVAMDRYRVFPHPVESPDAGGRQLVYDPADALASPFGWHYVGGASPAVYGDTTGNNVGVHSDDGAGGFYLPWGGDFHAFDFPLDLGGVSLDAMITNVFYWVNWNHDLHYRYGFDEAAGNFQLHNYELGGEELDFVSVYVHDEVVGENGIFAAPPDGSTAGMKLGIFTDDPTGLTVTSPVSIVGDYGARPAIFGPALSGEGIQGTVVAAIDEVEGVGYTSMDGCSPFLNGAEVNGNIALVDRGICLFVEKVAHAQAAGATGVIVANNVPGIIGGMFGEDPTISIPSVLITKINGTLLRENVVSGVSVELHTTDLPNRDAAFDSEIIIHEYGHGVSSRLTGGPANASCLSSSQSDAMGEGWSDFWAVALLTQASHSATDRRPLGTFALGQPINGMGMRNFPYSTDLGINPLTYGDLANIDLPHGGGEIGASALLEVYWNLVEVHGFDADVTFGTGGNNIALELVMDAIKLQPCNPSFLDVRDAMLLADLNNNEAANRCSIWEGFAKRGMGQSAYDGGNSGSLDVAEDFSVPIECVPEPRQWALSLAAMLTLGVLRCMNSRWD